MVYIYLLKSENDGSFYTGISIDPNKRLLLHNKGSTISTKLKKPWELVYKKPHPTYEKARKHELWLKKKSREYKNKLAG